MKKIKHLTVLPIALFFIIPQAQAADPSPCNGLLSLGLYNTQFRTDATQARSLVLAKFCSADFNTLTDANTYKVGASTNMQVLDIEASYDLLTGSFSTGVIDTGKRNSILQKQTESCKGTFNSDVYSKAASDDARSAYQGALDAWSQCNILNTKGIKFEAKPSQNLQGFTVDLSAPTPSRENPPAFRGLTLEGGNATCTTQLTPRSTASITGKLITVNASTYLNLNTTPLTINCKREMLDDGMGINGKYAEATGLHFDTSAGSVVVPLAAIGKVPRVDYDKAVGDVKVLVAETSKTTDEKFKGLEAIVNTKASASDVLTTQGQVTQIQSTLNNHVPMWHEFEKPLITEVSFTGWDPKNISLSGVPANAKYILANVFITSSQMDHFNVALGRSNFSWKTWVDQRGLRPSTEFNRFSDHQVLLTYYGEGDAFSSRYGIWYSSQIIPIHNNSSVDFFASGNGSASWLYLVIRAYSN